MPKFFRITYFIFMIVCTIFLVYGGYVISSLLMVGFAPQGLLVAFRLVMGFIAGIGAVTLLAEAFLGLGLNINRKEK
jgi:hypothetical protein